MAECAPPQTSLDVAFSLGITDPTLLSQAISLPPEAVPSLLGLKPIKTNKTQEKTKEQIMRKNRKRFEKFVRELRTSQKYIDFKYKFLKVLGRIETFSDIDKCINDFLIDEAIEYSPVLTEIARLFFALKLIKKFEKHVPELLAPTSADADNGNNSNSDIVLLNKAISLLIDKRAYKKLKQILNKILHPKSS